MKIFIKNLKVKCLIGIHPHERKKKQEIVLHVELEVEGRHAAKTDKITDAVDYDELAQKLCAVASQSKFYLLEKLANELLKVILKDKRILNARLQVEKPKALRNADSVTLEVSS